jgi:lysophospholipase L1-like esterase
MILSVGVNDSARLVRSRAHQPLGQPTHERNYTEFGEFEAAIATLLDQAQRLCPVLFIGMVPVDEAKMPFLDCFNYNHADQQRYKAATQLACHERQIPYLDIFEIWRQRGEQWWRSRLSLDGLHPNVAGYQSLFTEVLQWQAFIQQTGTNQ